MADAPGSEEYISAAFNLSGLILGTGTSEACSNLGCKKGSVKLRTGCVHVNLRKLVKGNIWSPIMLQLLQL